MSDTCINFCVNPTYFLLRYSVLPLTDVAVEGAFVVVSVVDDARHEVCLFCRVLCVCAVIAHDHC